MPNSQRKAFQKMRRKMKAAMPPMTYG